MTLARRFPRHTMLALVACTTPQAKPTASDPPSPTSWLPHPATWPALTSADDTATPPGGGGSPCDHLIWEWTTPDIVPTTWLDWTVQRYDGPHRVHGTWHDGTPFDGTLTATIDVSQVRWQHVDTTYQRLDTGAPDPTPTWTDTGAPGLPLDACPFAYEVLAQFTLVVDGDAMSLTWSNLGNELLAPERGGAPLHIAGAGLPAEALPDGFTWPAGIVGTPTDLSVGGDVQSDGTLHLTGMTRAADAQGATRSWTLFDVREAAP